MAHILITGGSQRLGLHMTEYFLAEGWRVSTVTRRSSAALDAMKCPQLTIYPVGQYQIEAIAPCCKALAAEPLDAIVHNASLFAKDADTATEADAQLREMMTVHVNLPRYINQRLAATLQQSDNANIIQMTDIYTENPNESYANYCASKAATANLALSAAKQLAPKIRVNCIAPGALQFLPEHSDSAKQAVLGASLIQREAGFEPVIETINYLLRTTFITGTTLKVDGGRSLCR